MPVNSIIFVLIKNGILFRRIVPIPLALVELLPSFSLGIELDPLPPRKVSEPVESEH